MNKSKQVQENQVPTPPANHEQVQTPSAVDSVKTEERNEDDISQFKAYCEGKPYVIFDKGELAHFIDLLSHVSRLGFDIYSQSFKVDFSRHKETGYVKFIYNNGQFMAISDVTAVVVGDFKSAILSADSILRIFTASKGYFMMYQEEKDTYGYVYGGKAFIETIHVEEDICAIDVLMDKVAGDPIEEVKVEPVFVQLLKSLYDIAKTGTRAEEKAIYFEKDSTYIYSGSVLGKFPGVGLKQTLQDLDISILSKYLSDVVGQICVQEHNLFNRYSTPTRSVYLAKKSLELTDDMKYKNHALKQFVGVPVSELDTRIRFLMGFKDNSDDVLLSTSKEGLVLTCMQSAVDNGSIFRIKGQVIGGISDIRVGLSTLKTFLAVFKGYINLFAEGNKLYIEGPEGQLVIYANG